MARSTFAMLLLCGTFACVQATGLDDLEFGAGGEAASGSQGGGAQGGQSTQVGPGGSGGQVGLGGSGGMAGMGGSTSNSGGSTPSTQDLITNGDFSNNLANWTLGNNPVNGEDTNSTFYVANGVCQNVPSMGPSARIIYQDIAVPTNVTSASFSMQFAQDNTAALDPQNVQVIEKDPYDNSNNNFEENAFRVDIIDPGQDQFYAPILLEVYAPTMSLGSMSNLQPVSGNDSELLTLFQAHEGQTLRLRIAQVESTDPWLLWIDDVSIVATGVH